MEELSNEGCHDKRAVQGSCREDCNENTAKKSKSADYTQSVVKQKQDIKLDYQKSEGENFQELRTEGRSPGNNEFDDGKTTIGKEIKEID